MTRPLFRLWRRLGRRGSAMLLLAFIDLTLAYFYLNPPPVDVRSPSALYLASIAPLSVWGALWGAIGVICLQQAFSRDDKVGYGCAVLLKVLWALLHLLGGIFVGLTSGYLYFVLWIVAAGWVFVIATWPEPVWPEDPPPVVPRPDLPPDR